MSKYNALWDWISENDADSLKLTFIWPVLKGR